tara:strand:+ start:1074 stop:1379 length:306 start_codon:yes stop_codon:yes gene_type:complete
MKWKEILKNYPQINEMLQHRIESQQTLETLSWTLTEVFAQYPHLFQELILKNFINSINAMVDSVKLGRGDALIPPASNKIPEHLGIKETYNRLIQEGKYFR